MITPTVGRVVLFVPRDPLEASDRVLLAGQPHAAIVAHVTGERLVNLCVMDSHGRTFGQTDVILRQPEDAAPDGDYCEWMPYQIEQAARA